MKHQTQADQLIRTTTPGRLATWESDLLVPVGQALAIAGAVGLASGVLVLLWLRPGQWALAGRVAGTAAALSLAPTVIAFVLGHRRALWKVEELIGVDVDGDRQVGEPEPQEPPWVRAEVHDADKQQTTYADLPATKSELRRVAIACLRNGKAFSRPALAGVISQWTYNRLAKVMVKRGLAYKLPGNKRMLSPGGRALLRHILEE